MRDRIADGVGLSFSHAEEGLLVCTGTDPTDPRDVLTDDGTVPALERLTLLHDHADTVISSGTSYRPAEGHLELVAHLGTEPESAPEWEVSHFMGEYATYPSI